jgi:TNF receptor-associated protein 1
MDAQYQEQLAKLLKFETSVGTEGDLITLDEYISRCPPEQKTIYYLIAPDRKSAFASPYYETFKKHNKEVLFMYNSIDDFVMSNLRNYSGKALKSAEDSSVKLEEELSEDEKNKLKAAEEGEEKEGEEGKNKTPKTKGLDEAETQQFCDWLKVTLGSRVRAVKVKLTSFPIYERRISNIIGIIGVYVCAPTGHSPLVGVSRHHH